jgi:hypothetical protein
VPGSGGEPLPDARSARRDRRGDRRIHQLGQVPGRGAEVIVI